MQTFPGPAVFGGPLAVDRMPMTPAAPTALRLDAASLPAETWDDPARGTLSWVTLFSQGRTASDSLVCGVAEILPGQHFAAHCHAESEVYFGLEGEGEVMINGTPHRLSPGVALFIPGMALHGVPQVSQRLRWFYAFARDSFDQITYHFPHEGAVAAPPIPRPK